jgi:hypothetical protein
LKRAAVVLVSALSVLLVATIPAALAIPTADASIMFSPPSCAQPGCTGFNIQFTVVQDSNCPSGGFYSGTETVTPPGGSPSTLTLPTTACGSSVIENNGIHPPEGVNVCTIPFAGTWTYEFSGSTQNAAGAGVSVFDVTNTYTVTPCAPSVPEFPAGLALLVAVSVPLLLILRSRMYPLK